jgi:hypothetical protein
MNKSLKKRCLNAYILALGLALPVAALGLWLVNLFPYHPGFLAIIGWIILLPIGTVIGSLQGLSYVLSSSIGLLAEATVIFLFLATWVMITRKQNVKQYSSRRRLGTISALVVVNILVIPSLISHFEEMRPPLETPEVMLPGEIIGEKDKTRSKTVDFGKIAFARGRLFIASGIGLIEVEGSEVSAVYRWHVNSRIDGVWKGPYGQSLWIQQRVTNNLSTLDEKGWKNIELPVPQRGYTRGDMLQGINIAASGSDSWLSGGSSLWKWDTSKSVWENFQIPGMESVYESVKVYGAKGQPLVARGANGMFDSKKSAALLKRTKDGKWVEALVDECCFKDLTEVGDKLYFRNKKGELISISNGKTEVISAPGRVEAITTDGEQLILSINDIGIFSFNGEWKKLFNNHYSFGSVDQRVYLSAHDGRIAVSISKYSDTLSRYGLWVSVGNELVKVEVPD